MARSNSQPPAIEHPTNLDIAWAAGIFEGEGWCGRTVRYKNGTGTGTRLSVGQKDRWLLDRLQALFGGTISVNHQRFGEFWYWRLSGPRCRGFLMTIYKFLSPRRKAQARNALGV